MFRALGFRVEGPDTPRSLQKKSLLSELRSGPRSNGLGPAKIVVGLGVSGVGLKAWGLQGFGIQDLGKHVLVHSKDPTFSQAPSTGGPA